MCDPASALAAVASIGGGLIQQNAQSEAADRQQAAINASLEQSDNYSRQAESKALENATQYDATDRLKRFDETKTAAGDSLAQQLTASREAAPASSQPSGRLSQAFLTGDATAKADQLEQSIANARLMGNMRGSGDMLTNEGYQNANYASQLGLIGRNAQGSARASVPGIESAGQVDGGKMMAGGILSSAGAGLPGSGFGSKLNKMFGS